MKRNYYKEIMDILSGNPLGEVYGSTPITFFRACQEYDWYYTMYEKISSNAGKVIQNYVEEDNYLAKRRRKEKQKQEQKMNREKNPRLDVEEKLYAEFFTKIYFEYYANDYIWQKVVNCDERVSKILDDYFQGTQPKYTKFITEAVSKAYQSGYRKVDLENLHNAMEIVEEALHTPMPMIETSVEKVISEERLELLLSYLERGLIPHFLFTVAKMARALTSGSYHKYTPNNKEVYFNLKCEYNLSELKLYIHGGEDEGGYPVDGLEGLLERYTQTRKDLSELGQKYSLHRK